MSNEMQKAYTAVLNAVIELRRTAHREGNEVAHDAACEMGEVLFDLQMELDPCREDPDAPELPPHAPGY